MAYKTFKVKDDKGSTSLGIGTTIKTFFISLFSVIYNYIYTFCFKLGNRTLFIFSHSAFFVKKGVTTAYSTSKRFLTKRFKIFYKKVSQNSKDFFEPVIRSYTQIRRIYATIRRKGKVGFFLYFKFAIFAIISSVTGFVKMLFRLSGILVPVLSVVLFLVTVNYFNNLQYVVLVEDNGERIGYIAN
ncbi:MAG: hypothetical protein IJC83_02715, partial [Oscillospiraceae bacterium]|nr:hypothetical protein [Oscillospiraceae bacterium]